MLAMLALVLLLVVTALNVASQQISEQDLRSEQFWKTLSPDLHVFDRDFAAEQYFFEDGVINAPRAKNLVLTEGYAQLDPLEWALPLSSMVGVIEKLHKMNLPITFCYLYDEFWFIFMRMHLSIEHILGAEYRRLPDFWAWRVDPANDERGWSVHRDKNYETLYPNGLPKTVSIWIPLTDATTSNGCMYVLPADRDPTYRKNETLEKHWEAIAPGIRALPVPAGGVLIWNQMVWHWGSRSNIRGKQPRYSLAVEFQAAPTQHIKQTPTTRTTTTTTPTTTPTTTNTPSTSNAEYYTRFTGEHNPADEYGYAVPVYNEPLTHPLLLFPFSDRLKLVAKQILQYKHMYPLSPEMQDLAERLLV